MFLQISKTHMFVFFLILPLSIAYYSDYEIPDCDYSISNYTMGSIYEDNLTLLLSSLSKSTPTTGYFEDTIGTGVNQVFGHAMCRGDLELPHGCSQCLNSAVIEITNLCPYKENAGLLYDECFLRYGNQNFFGNSMGGEILSFSYENITTDRAQFIKVRAQLFSKLLDEGINATSSPPFFAAGEAVVSRNLSVFALLQCTRDLSTADCKKCLQKIMDYIPYNMPYSVHVMFLIESCFSIHSNMIFFNRPSPSPPTLPPTLPSPSPPPPPLNAKGRGI